MASGTVAVIGVGLQGRAVVEDLEKRSQVQRIVAADRNLPGLQERLDGLGARRTEARLLDASDPGALRALLADGIDVAITMLPASFEEAVALAALDAGVHLVSTNYGRRLRPVRADGRGAGGGEQAGNRG